VIADFWMRIEPRLNFMATYSTIITPGSVDNSITAQATVVEYYSTTVACSFEGVVMRSGDFANGGQSRNPLDLRLEG